MDAFQSACVSAQRGPATEAAVTMPAEVLLRFLREARRVQDTGLKSYGLLVADPDSADYPFRVTDVVLLDSERNRRNEPGNRAAFEAQGDYFRRYDDAGFVADPRDHLEAYRRIEASGQEIVGMFHSHRRQPPNFSWIDFRLHNPAFRWHLIVSFHRGPFPGLQPFRVDKEDASQGIDPDDNRQGSELPYPGPEVTPVSLLVEGPPADVDACLDAIAPRDSSTFAATAAGHHAEQASPALHLH
jgi:proteasome lid subunit RPN8/RPN11